MTSGLITEIIIIYGRIILYIIYIYVCVYLLYTTIYDIILLYEMKIFDRDQTKRVLRQHVLYTWIIKFNTSLLVDFFFLFVDKGVKPLGAHTRVITYNP